jgi:outer membrane receptor protein involved in Fe transport
MFAFAVASVCLAGVARAQEEKGRIEGRLTRKDGGIVGASVVLHDTGVTGFTGTDGQFSFANLVPGTYSITLALGKNAVTISGVRVVAAETTTLEETVDWDVGFTDTLIVRGVSRYEERLVEAPAAATLVGEVEIARKASHAQLAKLLEFAPGAQVTQGGLWDFNIGTRGFNRALSRRVAVLLDGRDLALPFFGYQGWPAFSFPLDDLSSVELVRGPSAALFGANASGGVISMTSKEPRFSRGGMVRVAVGQLNTVNVEGRWAGELGKGWFARVVGGVRRSDGFAVSRVDGPEYSVPCAPAAFGDCLPAEVVPFDGEGARVVFGGLRLDKYLSGGRLLTLEGGHAHGGFGVFQATGQRAKSIGTDGQRPWSRVSVKGDGFRVAASYDGYIEPSGYLGLTTATEFNSDSYRLHVEAQTNRSFRQGNVKVVAGAEAGIERMDSYNPNVGGQTFLFRPVASNMQALFGQASWNVTSKLRALVAGRGDWSSLYDFQLSPRGALIYSATPHQTIRLTYSQAFQVSNSLEYFLKAPVAPPVDLTALNDICSAFDVACGFGPTPVLALGNEDLDVEHVRTWEVGYKGLLASRGLLTLDYYRSHSSNMVTSLLPQLGTPLGRLNPRFGPWEGPDGLPSAVVNQIRTAVPQLSNLDGSNILAAASYTNFGDVEIQGFDVGLTYSFPAGWQTTSTYSWFDFNPSDQQPGTEDLLLPNTPTHAFSVGVAYDRGRIGASVDAHWVDDFRWADGFFLGDVESYTVVDATATYPLSAAVSIALNVSNVFDDRHWETFGGALLKRRALVSLQYDW